MSHGNVSVVFPPGRAGAPWFATVLALLVLASLVGPAFYAYDAYGARTLEYRVRADGLWVRYGLARIAIPASEVAAVGRLDDPGPMRRVAGVDRLGVQRGWWSLEGYGRVYRLTTADRDLVFVDTVAGATRARPGIRYVFSPEDPDAFVRLLAAVQRGDVPAEVAGGGRAFRPARARAGHPAAGALFLLLAVSTPILLGGGVVLIAHGRRSLRYRVDAEGIAIRHLFGEHRFPWTSIREVRRHEGPVRCLRVVGAALPGYYAGTFLVRGHGTVRVLATRLRGPLVWIDAGPQGSLVTSPEDVDGFMGAVARYGPDVGHPPRGGGIS